MKIHEIFILNWFIYKTVVIHLKIFYSQTRQGKWEDAKKLCTMILIYEPKNPEALQFKDTIEEKIKVRFEPE